MSAVDAPTRAGATGESQERRHSESRVHKRARWQDESHNKSRARTEAADRSPGPCGSATVEKREEPTCARLWHVFSGPDRPESLGRAAQALGVGTKEWDPVHPDGGDIMDDATFEGMQRRVSTAGPRDVLWLGTVCSSFSRIRGKGVGPPAVRDRREVEGLRSMQAEYGAYLRKHNEMVRRSCVLASIAWSAGGTYVLENPADVGDVDSHLFREEEVESPSIWLMPCVIELMQETGAGPIIFPQCALGSEFQKQTQLLAAGPRAERLRILDTLKCECTSHAKRAEGFDEHGRARSAEAAAYPPQMCGVCCALLFTECDEAAALSTRQLAEPKPMLQEQRRMAADALIRAAVARATAEEAAASEEATANAQARPTQLNATQAEEVRQRTWSAAPGDIPTAWEEAEDVLGERFAAAREVALQYVSRRRLEPESDGALLRRPMPEPCPGVKTEKREERRRVEWPAGAPPRPIHASQLFMGTAFAELCNDVERAVEACGGRWPRFTASATYPQSVMQPWARGIVWDTANVCDVVPLQPFDGRDMVPNDLSAAFFTEWADRLGALDADMLHQVCVTGAEGRSACELTTVVQGHHGGLRANPKPAEESVAKDTERGWITPGRPFPPTIPCRMVAKNVVEQHKWRIDPQGRLTKKLKFRVSTDDSIDVDGVESRNHTMSKEDWADPGLPGPRTLAEAVAIVKAAAAHAGARASELELERVALWALDLSDAYRRCHVQRAEWWLQAFVWSDGVRLDKRAVFGSAHMPGLFQRITTFVLRVARHRVRLYDRAHPYAAAREAWAADRVTQHGAHNGSEQAFVYLDDAFGLTILGKGEPLQGAPPGALPVTTLVEVRQDTRGGARVRLRLFACRSRPEVHLAIQDETFTEAGWDIEREKLQLGFAITVLGLGVSTEGRGHVYVPEAKRLGMLRDIEGQLEAREGEAKVVPRAEVETLTGRCGHIAVVAAEGNAYLSPMWRISCATREVKLRSGRKVRAKPRELHVGGKSATVREYQAALRWWHAALTTGVTVPLAPRRRFPSIEEAGVAFFFTDAAREKGTGFGAFSFVRVASDGHERRYFPYVSRRWPEDILKALQSDEISMAAGELFGNVAMAVALARALPGVSHIVCFTDSSASVGAINSGNSPSLQLNALVQWLFQQLPGVQFLAVHQQGCRNQRADGISRADAEAVIRSAEASGATPWPLEVDSATWEALTRAWTAPQRTAPSLVP